MRYFIYDVVSQRILGWASNLEQVLDLVHAHDWNREARTDEGRLPHEKRRVDWDSAERLGQYGHTGYWEAV